MRNRVFHLGVLALVAVGAAGQDLWKQARDHTRLHRFSTLFTAQDVRDSLSNDRGIAEAIEWCKQTAVTKVYLETYRDTYQAERAALLKARDAFRRAGFLVSGAVTTSRIGKVSTGWNQVSCYTNLSTQEQLQKIFEFVAGLFNEVVVNDYLFTDCACNECDTARKAREVTIGEMKINVPTDTWEDYRHELMVSLSKQRVIGAARRVNPQVRIIVKYPRWYDQYHERGYDVIDQTKLFDRIWVGTESRDRGTPNAFMPYQSYFLMRWLGGIGGPKTGGGWFDSIRTTEKTFIEQARQTVLAGARETVLYNYGELRRNYGPQDLEALRPLIPELIEVARQVRQRRVVGVAAYKPPNSHPEDELNIYDFVGMLGLPMTPTHLFPTDAKAAFFPVQALQDRDLGTKLSEFVASGKPVLVTDGLSRRLAGKVKLGAENVHVLKVGGRPDTVLNLTPAELNPLRDALLAPFGVDFDAPDEVGLYWFTDGSWVVQNFADPPVRVKLNGEELEIGGREWAYRFR